jgi:uncharacterized membrane protein
MLWIFLHLFILADAVHPLRSATHRSFTMTNAQSFESPSTSPPPTGAIKQRINMSDTDRWIASLVGGAMIGFGIMRRRWDSAVFALIGGGITYIGVRGNSPIYQALGANTAVEGQPVLVERSITIGMAPQELYNFWRNFENLPQFMAHLEDVTVQNNTRSHWVAKGPASTQFEWDAEITQDQPNELIGWRSLPGADVQNQGTVRFQPAPGNRGTVVRVTMQYDPPAGPLGAAIAKLFGEEPNVQVDGDLRRLKQMLEAGEIATIEGQPSGTRSVVGNVLSPTS